MKKIILVIIISISFTINYVPSSVLANSNDNAGQQQQQEENEDQENEEEENEDGENEQNYSSSIVSSVKVIAEHVVKSQPAYVGLQIIKFFTVGQVERFKQNTVMFFVDADRYLFNLSGFTQDEIFINHKYVFSGVGVFVAVILLVANFLVAIYKGNNIDEDIKESLWRFAVFLPAMVVVIYFAVGVTKITDMVSVSMLKASIGGEKYDEALRDYYNFERDFAPEVPEDWEKRRNEAMEGTRVSGGALTYSFLYTALDAMDEGEGEENNVGNKTKHVAVGFFMGVIFLVSFYIIIFILMLYALIRSVVIIAFVLIAPFLLALPIYSGFKTANIFGLFLSLCVQQLAITFGFCITFLYFIEIPKGGGTAVVAPLVMFFGIFGLMALFSKYINTGATTSITYTTGIVYAKKYYNKGKKYIPTRFS